MEEKDMTMADFMAEIDSSLNSFNVGDIVKGTVVDISKDDITVNIGAAMDGRVSREEIADHLTGPIDEVVAIGEEIDVLIMKNSDSMGNLSLSKKRADRVTAWEKLDELIASGNPLKIKIKEAVKGGVVSEWNNIRLFMPGSQISATVRVNLEDMVGLEFDVKVIEVDKAARKAVVSRRALEEEEMKVARDKAVSTLNIGDSLTGKVTRLMEYGAFVDIGGFEGLLHISEMSWKKIMKPSDVLAVGDQIDVSILDINKQKGTVSLKLSNITGDPWNNIDEHLTIGEIYNGTITKVLAFGVLVEIGEGLEGLVHISQISEDRINKPTEKVKLGEQVKVVVLDINKEEKRISLSIKAALGEDEADYEEYLEDEEIVTTLGDLFSDKLSKLKF